MKTATNNSGVPYSLKPDNKSFNNQKENVGINVAVASSKQNLLYILNTSFLVIVAFVAGYNLKSWQMQNSINNAINNTAQYIEKAKENYIRSEQLLADLENSGNTHFEGIVHKPVENDIEGSLVEIQPDNSIVTKNIFQEPAQPETPPVLAKTRVKKTLKKPIPSINIHHTIKRGESLSSLVKKADMNDFLIANPQIVNPDIIYPGQQIVIKIPKQSILTGSYLNNYFIRPVITTNGKRIYRLSKSFIIPESETLLSHIIEQPGQLILKSTKPYINLSDFTNTMKEEIHGDQITIQTRKDKISNLVINQTGIHFETIRSNPIFYINSYRGIKSTKKLGYYGQIDTIKDYLIKYLASLQPENSDNLLFHFMIFGETIVQTNFLDATAFTDNSIKSKIIIGLIHINNQTNNTLFTLQRSLTNCKIKKGLMGELSQGNFTKFQQ